MDLITVLLLLSIGWVGLRYSMAWLTLISGFILVAYVLGFRREKRPVASGGGPKIRPIIVKRRYTGPASIYPSVMKMKVQPNWNTNDWWENAFAAAGSFAGVVANGFSPRGTKL